MIQVQIKNIDKIRRALASAPGVFAKRFDRAIKKSIFRIVAVTIPRTPIISGDLRRSVARDVSFKPLYGSIHPMINYAIFVHEGTRFMTGQPFLKEGVQAAESEINQVFQNELQQGLNEIARKGR